MVTDVSIESAMRPSAGADGCPAGLGNPLRPTGNRKQIDRLGDDQQRTASPSSTPRQRPEPNTDFPRRNSIYLPPSPVSEIPRIRYRCKAIARAAVGTIEIADAAMMSCH